MHGLEVDNDKNIEKKEDKIIKNHEDNKAHTHELNIMEIKSDKKSDEIKYNPERERELEKKFKNVVPDLIGKLHGGNIIFSNFNKCFY